MTTVYLQQQTLRQCVRNISEGSTSLGLVAQTANIAEAIRLFNQTNGVVDLSATKKANLSPKALAKEAMGTVTNIGTKFTDLRDQIVALNQMPAALKAKWAPFFQHFSLAKKGWGLAGKVLSVPKTLKELDEAKALDHQESIQRVTFSFGCLILAILTGFMSVVNKLKNLEIIQFSEELSNRMDIFGTLFSGIASVIGLGFALRGIQRCLNFQQKLHAYESDGEKLEFLLASVTVSNEEQAIAGSLQTSWAKCKLRHVEARTSLFAVREILANAPRLIKALDKDQLESSSDAQVAEAQKLIALVKRESQKKMLGHIVALAVAKFSLIGLTAIGAPFVTASIALGTGSTLVGYIAPYIAPTLAKISES